MKKRKNNGPKVRPRNIARDSLFTEPAFLPKVSRSGEDYKKYKRDKKVDLE